MSEMNDVKNTVTQITDGLLNVVLTMHSFDAKSVSLLEKHWLRAQSEVLQGLLAVVQHRLDLVDSRHKTQKIALD